MEKVFCAAVCFIDAKQKKMCEQLEQGFLSHVTMQCMQNAILLWHFCLSVCLCVCLSVCLSVRAGIVCKRIAMCF